MIYIPTQKNINKYLKIWYNDLRSFGKKYGRRVIMKKKNSYRPLNTKTSTKTIPKSVGIKLGILLVIIMPIAALIAYSMNMNFFSIARILSIFVLIVSIVAYVKGEVLYSHPKATHHSNSVANKKNIGHKKYNANFSFSAQKGTVQVLLSILIIVLFTYLGQAFIK